MPEYRRGAKGPEVERIQVRLKELGKYRGPIDGDFGGGTESDVEAPARGRRDSSARASRQAARIPEPGPHGRVRDERAHPRLLRVYRR